ncbi:hypothetical protein SLEP1_g15624 [Rubroshorea leprosula]|uniref:Uncharacterized protein n=1 Tax=Rubroshorea leprosula TaxID=152421 RepID=A0AAV5IYQ5_9ROSI|nr:hypothetical protein SLEP1_g15624 [Rubroshorea leprosula]
MKLVNELDSGMGVLGEGGAGVDFCDVESRGLRLLLGVQYQVTNGGNNGQAAKPTAILLETALVFYAGEGPLMNAVLIGLVLPLHNPFFCKIFLLLVYPLYIFWLCSGMKFRRSDEGGQKSRRWFMGRWTRGRCPMTTLWVNDKWQLTH